MLDFGPGSFFLSSSQLADSPSFRHGIPASTEKALRLYACEIIQEACILLRLSQAVSATAQVLLHRYFCKQSFRDFDARTVAASCFWLSMKLEEEEGATYRKSKPSMLNDVVSMFEHIRARREGGVAWPIYSPEFQKRKEEIMKQEARVLSELGFVCNVEHPHKLLLGYLNCLGAPQELIQESWNLVNDSLRTTLCVSYPSNVVACGVIFAAARRLSIPLPDSPTWWIVFDVTIEQVMDVCYTLADLYRQPKSQFISLNKADAVVVSASLSHASARCTDRNQICGPSSNDPNKKSPADTRCGNVLPVNPFLSVSTLLNPSLMNGPGSSQPELTAPLNHYPQHECQSQLSVPSRCVSSQGVLVEAEESNSNVNKSSSQSEGDASSNILLVAEKSSVDTRSSCDAYSRRKHNSDGRNRCNRSESMESEERSHKRQRWDSVERSMESKERSHKRESRDLVERYGKSRYHSFQSGNNIYVDQSSSNRFSRDRIEYSRDGRCSSRYNKDGKHYSSQHSERVKV